MLEFHVSALDTDQREHGGDLAEAESRHGLDQERRGLLGGSAFVRKPGVTAGCGLGHYGRDSCLCGDNLPTASHQPCVGQRRRSGESAQENREKMCGTHIDIVFVSRRKVELKRKVVVGKKGEELQQTVEMGRLFNSGCCGDTVGYARLQKEQVMT